MVAEVEQAHEGSIERLRLVPGGLYAVTIGGSTPHARVWHVNRERLRELQG